MLVYFSHYRITIVLIDETFNEYFSILQHVPFYGYRYSGIILECSTKTT